MAMSIQIERHGAEDRGINEDDAERRSPMLSSKLRYDNKSWVDNIEWSYHGGKSSKWYWWTSYGKIYFTQIVCELLYICT